VRKKWLILPLIAVLATLAVVAFLAWSAAQDARQEALLDARYHEAEARVQLTESRMHRLAQGGAPREEVMQAGQENTKAWKELGALRSERARRAAPWYARLRQEVRRRTGL
jgi:hypothetical protein